MGETEINEYPKAIRREEEENGVDIKEDGEIRGGARS